MSTSVKHFVASTNRIPGCTHVLLITTGSVASIKAPQIVHELLEVRHLERKGIDLRLKGLITISFVPV